MSTPSSEVPLVEAIGRTTGEGEEPVSTWLDQHDAEDTPNDSSQMVSDDPFGQMKEIKVAANELKGEDEEATEGDAPEGEVETVADEKDGDYERAISALRASRLSATVIGKLTRAEILAEGLAMAEGQASTQEKFDEHSRVAEELKQLREGKESGQEPGDVESTGQPSTVNLEAATKAFAEATGLSEEQVGPSLAQLGEAVAGPINAQIREGLGALQLMDRVMSSMLHRSARAELVAGDYSQLKESEAYAPVQAKAQQLLNSGSYRGMDPYDAHVEATRDAAGILLRPTLKAQAAAEVSKAHAARNKGTARRPSGQNRTAELTDEQRASATLDRLEARDAQR